jgi:4-amino-4-deoxy-L-arabinose transferase-like glycosyltransferase
MMETDAPRADPHAVDDASSSGWLASRTHWWAAVATATGLGLALRLFDIFVRRHDYDPFRGGDAFYYFHQGRFLASGDGYIDPVLKLFLGPTKQSAYHPPLYGTFLGAVDWLGFDSVDQNRVASALLGCATIVLIALVARRIAGPRVGVIAAVAAAFYPPLWINDSMLLSETMAAFVVAAVLFAAYRFHDRPRALGAALLGACIALSILTRGELLLLVPLILLPLTLSPRVGSWKTRLGYLGAGVAAIVVIVGPWVGYNLSRFDKPEFISSGTGATLYTGSCHEAWYGAHIGYAGLLCRQPDLPRSWDESQQDAYFRRRAIDYTKSHWKRAPLVLAARVGRLWYVFDPGQEIHLDGTAESRGVTTAQLAFAGYAILIPFAIAGVIILHRRKVMILPLVALAVSVTLAVIVAFGIQRYRVPADVAIVVAAAVGIDALWSSFAKRHGRRTVSGPPPRRS